MLALLPLAIGVGEGADAQAPLVRAVVGGLASYEENRPARAEHGRGVAVRSGGSTISDLAFRTFKQREKPKNLLLFRNGYPILDHVRKQRSSDRFAIGSRSS